MRRLLPLAALLLAVPALAQPQVYRSGLVVTLPEGWAGPAEVDESGLPGLASYRFENRSDSSALRGAVLHVERLTGLNPVMRERWQQGRVPYGYHGARPVAPLSASPLPGAVGFRTEREGMVGHVYFLVRGPVYWAIQVEAPEAVFTPHEAVLLDLVRTLGLEVANSTGGE
ncbi:MAG TPA: hypothetical protein VK002_13340 [Rubricoccaceae bacterium]|nr:hypothetical protein [Rubricoccaceae bacterium]